MHIESKKISMKVLLAGLMILVFSLTACQSERTPEPTLKGSAPEGSLWDGVPEPEGAQYQTDNSVQEGGLHAYYTSDTSPGDFVNSYNQQLEASGWIIVSSGGDPSGQFGGGSSATKDTRFLKFNAGGPGGVSYIDICVWPNGEPNDNNCGQNQNNNTLKGAAPPSDDGTSGLLAGIPEPEGATYQATDSIQEGGLHAFWTTSMTPGEFVESYNQQLEANGWSIVSSGGDPFGTFGGGSTATQGERYFKFNAGGPGNGTTFIDLCVWPTQPSDNNCGQNQNNNTLKGAAQPSEDTPGGLLAGVPEPEGATYQATDSIQEGGLHGFYTSNSAPADVVTAYNSALEANGWTIQNTGGDPFGAFGAGTTATQGERYLKINAGGPGGVSYIDICVWPAQPSDDNCGQNQNNNTLKGAAVPSEGETGGLLANVPEPEGVTYQATDSIQEGGLHGYYTSNSAPGEIVSTYQSALEGNGWAIESSGGDPSGQFGAGLTATFEGRYLKMNAGGPGDMTFIDICVWPAQPSDDNCGQNQNNNN